MARQAKLDALDVYLARLRKPPSADEGLAAVSGLLDRKIERQQAAKAAKQRN